MRAFVNWLDKCPLLLKIIFAIPVLDIIWVVYRLAKSIANKNILGIVLAIILIVVGLPFLWLIDMITIILFNKVLWF